MTTDIPPALDPDLCALADAYGVATSYDDWQQRPVQVAAETVTTVLGLLGVDAGSPATIRAALDDVRLRRWRELVAPTVVVREGGGTVAVRAPVAEPVSMSLELEDGSQLDLALPPAPEETEVVDGTAHASWSVPIPADLPLGWHRLTVAAGERRACATVVVTPARLEQPAGMERQVWGWMIQLYALRSAGSWGMGDLGDLEQLVGWSGAELGAGAVLCNPLHAVPPVAPMENSPYSPASRRFFSPLYLAIEAVPEYAVLTEPDATRVRELAAAARRRNSAERIDRDVVWATKAPALECLFRARSDPSRDGAFAQFREREGQGLADFALWSALAERHGRRYQDWPAELQRPGAPGVEQARAELAERVEFHAWLQFLCDEQLAAAQRAARNSGMPLGLIHDLAVGVEPGGADAWALQDVLAAGVSVGAPPDSFNQQGQSWGLPPWRPDRLAAVGYAPYRDMLRTVLRHAGGIRIDHILGLFRLWWVPPGRPASEGTYVRYDDEALLGILALEASRAGALVVGEDLGTVEPRVRTAMAERGILGSAVLWFERAQDADGNDQGPLPPSQWRELTLASVTTHDLPTAAGFLSGEHVRVRADLDQLAGPVDDEWRSAEAERDALLRLLRDEGLLGADAGPEDTVLAMHALLTRTPSRLVLASPGDAVGDLRQPNLPGTLDEYPNWRLPVSGPDGRPISLEELRASQRVRRLAEVLTGGVDSVPSAVRTATTPRVQ